MIAGERVELRRGQQVEVWTAGGDFEGAGVVVEEWSGRGYTVRLEDGRLLYRTAERVTLRWVA